MRPRGVAVAVSVRQDRQLDHSDGLCIVNNRQIVEFAAVVSAHSAHLITGNGELPAGALEKFWDRSQRRLKMWLSALAHFQRQSNEIVSDEHRQLWSDLQPVISEIFVSEILTRVWGAVLTAMDQTRGTHKLEPIARNVLIGHLDARKRALELLVSDSTLTVEELRPLDTIRRRVERWTDLLLGHLVERYHVDDFAFDANRAREFGGQQLLQNSERSHEQVWLLMLIGLRSSFTNDPTSPPNELLQEELIASILACFPASAFEPVSPFRTILAQRLAYQDRAIPSAATPVEQISFRKLRHRFDH